MKTKLIKMKLGDRSYPILIGERSIASVLKSIPKNTTKIIVISDERLVEKRKELLRALRPATVAVVELPVRAGEKLKSMDVIYPLYGKLLEHKADRNSLIIALGGGTIGDAVGFVAATYLRGINWIGIPTTLLSQVDSSVGGKTGINHEAGKNLIGAFHQPIAVICDPSALKTLGPREMISGLGEIVKYSMTFDKSFFKWLEKNMPALLSGEAAALTIAIKKSLEWKCFSVSQDEYDRLGAREVLNFGHTFGHALESATGYKKFQHGEAVIWGMRFAIALSGIRGKLAKPKAQRMNDLLSQLRVPAIPKTITKQELFSHMKRDKKSQGETIRFVLVDEIGHSVSDASVTREDLDQAFYAVTGREA